MDCHICDCRSSESPTDGESHFHMDCAEHMDYPPEPGNLAGYPNFWTVPEASSYSLFLYQLATAAAKAALREFDKILSYHVK